MKTISFNTGRSYSANGQRIAATQLECGRVLFVDVDRRLQYVTAAPCELTPSAVMRFYDYNSTTDAYGMLDYQIRQNLVAKLEALAKEVQP